MSRIWVLESNLIEKVADKEKYNVTHLGENN